MKTNTVEVTRENLYAEVWATPMIKLAKKYSLSDVGLRKVCKRNHIPTPPAGYWAKLMHGKKVKRPNLPPMEDAPPIHFEMPASNDLGLEDSSLADETAKLLALEALEENRIIVSEETGRLHPFTKAVKAGEKLENYRTTLRIDVSKPPITRAFRVADVLIRALDARGYLTNGIFEQDLSLSISEICNIVPTERTRERMAKYGTTRGGPWHAYDHIPTGRLKLHFSSTRDYLRSDLRHNWADGKTQRVEDFLNDLICCLIIQAASQQDSILTRARQEKERLERERREREEAERIRKEREHRAEQIRKARELRDNLISEAKDWQNADLIRRYITAYEEKFGPTEQTKWARKEADRIDPMMKGDKG
ncbi:MAG: hypothetical protein WCH86_02995 [Kiritimatiellales bacterium]